MLAVIKTGGKQYLISPGKRIEVEKMDASPGDKVEFKEVLFFEDDKGEFLLGNPCVEGVKVEGEVLEEGKGEKKRVFKYKPKKRYKVKKGHRQPFMRVEIKEIKWGSKGSEKKTSSSSNSKSGSKSTKKSSSAKTTSKGSTATKKSSGSTGKKSSGTTSQKKSTKQSSAKQKKDTQE